MRSAILMMVLCLGAACGGKNQTQCQSACSAGQGRCVAGANSIEECTLGADGCYGWGAATPCPGGQVCHSDGTGDNADLCEDTCLTLGQGCDAGMPPMDAGMPSTDAGQGCQNTCTTRGMLQCSGETVQKCVADRTTGCLSWLNVMPCGSGTTCQNGQCQNTCAIPCGASCCTTGSVCYVDASGNDTCAPSCMTNTDCAPSAPCCTPVSDAQGNWTAQGACTAGGVGAACLCATRTDCDSGNECVPAVTSPNGAIVTQYICKPDDAQAGDGCHGVTETCSSGYDCWKDTQGNEFCATSCTSMADCNTGLCCLMGTCANDFESCNGVSKGSSGLGYCAPCPQ